MQRPGDAARWRSPGCTRVGMPLHTDRACPGERDVDTAVEVTQTPSYKMLRFPRGSHMETVNYDGRGRGEAQQERYRFKVSEDLQ